MRPIIKVLANGSPVNGVFYSKLVRCTIRDESGQESDSLECDFDYRGYGIALPTEGTVLEPLFGYASGGLTSMGKFTVDGYTVDGGPGGLLLSVTAKAADVREELKEKKTEHFDSMTLGTMLQKVFSDAGSSIEVDGELAGIQVEYEARRDQSAMDFGTRMADRYNAICKPGGGKFIFVPRGKQRGGAVTVRRSECQSWSISGKPRPRYGKVVAKWHDPKENRTKFEKLQAGGKGPIRMIKAHFKNKDEAKAGAEAEATRLNRARGEGSFTQYGRTDVSAEDDVIASGFGPAENGLWRCKAVEHTFERGSGFTTTIEVEAPETPKN